VSSARPPRRRRRLTVCSLTQAASVREVENLRTQIHRVKGHTSAPIPMVLVGTKADLGSEREVSRETMQALADKWRVPYYETSAKRNWGIASVFEDVVRQMRAGGLGTGPKHRARKSKAGEHRCLLM
jgi:GTPase SAR1 family protein